MKLLLLLSLVLAYFIHNANSIDDIKKYLVLYILLAVTLYMLVGGSSGLDSLEGFGAQDTEALANLASMYKNGTMKVSNIECTGNIKVGKPGKEWYIKGNGSNHGDNFAIGTDANNWILKVSPNNVSAKDKMECQGMKMGPYHLKPKGASHGNNFAIGSDWNSWSFQMNNSGWTNSFKEHNIGGYTLKRHSWDFNNPFTRQTMKFHGLQQVGGTHMFINDKSIKT